MTQDEDEKGLFVCKFGVAASPINLYHFCKTHSSALFLQDSLNIPESEQLLLYSPTAAKLTSTSNESFLSETWQNHSDSLSDTKRHSDFNVSFTSSNNVSLSTRITPSVTNMSQSTDLETTDMTDGSGDVPLITSDFLTLMSTDVSNVSDTIKSYTLVSDTILSEIESDNKTLASLGSTTEIQQTSTAAVGIMETIRSESDNIVPTLTTSHGLMPTSATKVSTITF